MTPGYIHGLVYGMVIVPRVNRKARMHHAVLYPAHKQFRVRLITGETADVVTEGYTARRGSSPDPCGVVAQSVPASAVIAAPCLHIALHSRSRSGRSGTDVFPERNVAGFHRGSHHQQWHHRANMFDRDRLTKAVTACFTVPTSNSLLSFGVESIPISRSCVWSRLPATTGWSAD